MHRMDKLYFTVQQEYNHIFRRQLRPATGHLLYALTSAHVKHDWHDF